MPMVRAMRLLNSIEAGSTTSAQLQQYLTNGGIYSDFNSILQLQGQCNVLAGSATALTAINGSALAVTAVTASTYANAAISASSSARSTLQSSARTLLVSLETAYPSVWVPFNTWTAVSATSYGTINNIPSDSYTSALVYGAGYYVAINGTSGQSYFSTDGINWTAGGTVGLNLNALAYGNISGTDYWIGVGNDVSAASATAYYSTNHGVTWSTSTLPSTSVWISIAFYGGAFVAISGGNVASNATAYSTNGTTWTAGGNLPSSVKWSAVAGGLVGGSSGFVAVSSFNTTTSAAFASTVNNGVTWTARTAPSVNYWQSVAYNANINLWGVISGVVNYGGTNYGASANAVCYSTNGTTWTAGTATSTIQWNKIIAYGQGFILFNNSSTYYRYTADFSTYTLTQTNGTATIQGVATDGTTVVCRKYSATGTISSARPQYAFANIGNGATNIYPMSNMAYGNGIYLMASNFGYYSSTDGVNWTHTSNISWCVTTSDVNGTMTFVNYFNNKWWACSNLAGVTGFFSSPSTSPVLTTFILPSGSTVGSWNSIACNGSGSGTLIVATSSGAIWNKVAFNASSTFNNAYSIDSGATFTYNNVGFDYVNTSPLIWDGTNFVCLIAQSATQVDRLVYTTDGSSWSTSTNLLTGTFYNMVYGNGIYLSVNTAGTAYFFNTSPSGTTGNSATNALYNGTGSAFYGLSFINGYFYAADYSSSNTIWYSKDGITWTKQAPSSGTLSNPWSMGCLNNPNTVNYVMPIGTGNVTPLLRYNQ
jgi:hypothetical protein